MRSTGFSIKCSESHIVNYRILLCAVRGSTSPGPRVCALGQSQLPLEWNSFDQPAMRRPLRLGRLELFLLVGYQWAASPTPSPNCIGDVSRIPAHTVDLFR